MVAGKGWEVGEQPLVRLPVVGMVVEAAELRVRGFRAPMATSTRAGRRRPSGGGGFARANPNILVLNPSVLSHVFVGPKFALNLWSFKKIIPILDMPVLFYG